MYLGCAGSSLLCAGFSPAVVCSFLLVEASPVLWSAGFSSCRAWAQYLRLLGCRAQSQLSWHMGLVALQHVGSSRTRDRTHVSCIDGQILNHWATGEALNLNSTRLSCWLHNIWILSYPGLLPIWVNKCYYHAGQIDLLLCCLLTR